MPAVNCVLFVFIATMVFLVQSMSPNVGQPAYRYDPNSISQNERILKLFLRLAAYTANRLIQLKSLARLRNNDTEVPNPENSDVNVDTQELKDILKGKEQETEGLNTSTNLNDSEWRDKLSTPTEVSLNRFEESVLTTTPSIQSAVGTDSQFYKNEVAATPKSVDNRNDQRDWKTSDTPVELTNRLLFLDDYSNPNKLRSKVTELLGDELKKSSLRFIQESQRAIETQLKNGLNSTGSHVLEKIKDGGKVLAAGVGRLIDRTKVPIESRDIQMQANKLLGELSEDRMNQLSPSFRSLANFKIYDDPKGTNSRNQEVSEVTTKKSIVSLNYNFNENRMSGIDGKNNFHFSKIDDVNESVDSNSSEDDAQNLNVNVNLWRKFESQDVSNSTTETSKAETYLSEYPAENHTRAKEEILSTIDSSKGKEFTEENSLKRESNANEILKDVKTSEMLNTSKNSINESVNEDFMMEPTETSKHNAVNVKHLTEELSPFANETRQNFQVETSISNRTLKTHDDPNFPTAPEDYPDFAKYAKPNVDLDEEVSEANLQEITNQFIEALKPIDKRTYLVTQR